MLLQFWWGDFWETYVANLLHHLMIKYLLYLWLGILLSVASDSQWGASLYMTLGLLPENHHNCQWLLKEALVFSPQTAIYGCIEVWCCTLLLSWPCSQTCEQIIVLYRHPSWPDMLVVLLVEAVYLHCPQMVKCHLLYFFLWRSVAVYCTWLLCPGFCCANIFIPCTLNWFLYFSCILGSACFIFFLLWPALPLKCPFFSQLQHSVSSVGQSSLVWWQFPTEVAGLAHTLTSFFCSCSILAVFAFTMYSSLTLQFWIAVAAAVVALRFCIILSNLSELYTSEATWITSVDVTWSPTSIHFL